MEIRIFKNICKFAKECEHYQPKGYTCQHEDEAKSYCGIYKLHLLK